MPGKGVMQFRHTALVASQSVVAWQRVFPARKNGPQLILGIRKHWLKSLLILDDCGPEITLKAAACLNLP